jgi:hypothetical protein
MMKKFYESYLNKLYKKDIDTLFGENSKIIITEISYSTNIKKIHISANLIPSNHEFAVEVFPEGLEILIMESWKFMGIDEFDIMLTCSMEH